MGQEGRGRGGERERKRERERERRKERKKRVKEIERERQRMNEHKQTLWLGNKKNTVCNVLHTVCSVSLMGLLFNLKLTSKALHEYNLW